MTNGPWDKVGDATAVSRTKVLLVLSYLGRLRYLLIAMRSLGEFWPILAVATATSTLDT